ncbi:hypothetical protein Tco_1237015 [Tanacetum coccineum]
MAPMALSDSEVKTCSKTCLKNHETLKTQYDKLRIEFNKSESDLYSYKKGLALVEEQLVFYKKNEEKEDNLLKINNYDNATRSLDKVIGSQLVDNHKKGLGYNVVPPPLTILFAPPTIDLSYSGIKKFKEPEFVGYGVKVDKSVCEKSSKEIKKTPAAKIEFVRPKQQEKPVRKSVKYAEMYRSQKPRGNQRNWNNKKSHQLGSDFVMIKRACYVCGCFEHLQYTCKHKRHVNDQKQVKPVWNNSKRVNHHYSTRITRPNPKGNMIPQAILMRSGRKTVNAAKPKAAYNAVKRNRFNAVKSQQHVVLDSKEQSG